MLNLNHIIEDYLSEALAIEKPSNIQIKTRLSPIDDLLLDKIEISELIENFLSNAIEAMPEGGVITVSTDKVKDNEVVLTVQDQGSGISGATARNIGIPFFTTKENSAGLGFICYSIAPPPARIEFISTPGGTRFMVRFPVPADQKNSG